MPYRGCAPRWRPRPGRAWCTRCSSGRPVTGAGVAALTDGIQELLPCAAGAADGPVAGTVFKVERGPAGEKIAYVRMFSGTVRARDRLRFGPAHGPATAPARSPRSASSTGARPPRGTRSWPGRSASYGAWAAFRLATRWARGMVPLPRRGAHVLRAADAGNRGRARPSGRQGCAARRARRARRAGPADQRAAGRHPPGDPRLAVRRGAEGGHPGHAGRRVRPRRRVPRVRPRCASSGRPAAARPPSL